MVGNINIEFVTDQLGNKRAVLISFNDWQEIQTDLKELLQYRYMKKSLSSAFTEVKQIKEGKLPRKTLKEFLDEC